MSLDRLLSWLPRRLVPARVLPAGPRAERIAADRLEREGYRVLGRNLANRFGEIDLLVEAPDGRTVVVVEVKAREVGGAADPYHRPEDRVGREKQRRLTALAAQAARRYRLTDRPIRFDVIGVDLPAGGGEPVVRHHAGAFEATVG